MTLTELLIALIMAILMMLGIAAADFAMRRMDRTVSGDAQLYMRTLAMGEEIRQAARLATGDSSSFGICPSTNLDCNTTTENTMCFRVDTANTSDNYNDDTWRCYTKVPLSGGASGTEIYACTSAAPVDCAATDRWVGSVVNDVFTCAGVCYPPRLTADTATGQYFFEFQLVSRMVPTAGADIVAGAFNKKDATNPQVVVSFRVSPESHSF
jgi:hypothetical protein